MILQNCCVPFRPSTHLPREKPPKESNQLKVIKKLKANFGLNFRKSMLRGDSIISSILSPSTCERDSKTSILSSITVAARLPGSQTLTTQLRSKLASLQPNLIIEATRTRLTSDRRPCLKNLLRPPRVKSRVTERSSSPIVLPRKALLQARVFQDLTTTYGNSSATPSKDTHCLPIKPLGLLPDASESDDDAITIKDELNSPDYFRSAMAIKQYLKQNK